MVHAPARPDPGAPPVRVNLYSDTQTKPSRAMKEAMMAAGLNHPNIVQVYTIGLGGAGAAEHELLKRIANTSDSTSHDNNAPTGTYVFAPTPAQLVAAFQKVGSETLRLSR